MLEKLLAYLSHISHLESELPRQDAVKLISLCFNTWHTYYIRCITKPGLP